MNITFPKFSGVRCLMMPYIQGESESVPDEYLFYNDIISSVYLKKGDLGFLTIDESYVEAGKPHRGARSKFGRALHTEAGQLQETKTLKWGNYWGGQINVRLDRDVRILLASNLDNSCAVWNDEIEETTLDGDIGHLADRYPYNNADILRAGEVREIGILTPHESLPSPCNFNRQFLRIVSSGVYGREPYFTKNSKLEVE